LSGALEGWTLCFKGGETTAVLFLQEASGRAAAAHMAARPRQRLQRLIGVRAMCVVLQVISALPKARARCTLVATSLRKQQQQQEREDIAVAAACRRRLFPPPLRWLALLLQYILKLLLSLFLADSSPTSQK
jgi:hypothetical protein